MERDVTGTGSEKRKITAQEGQGRKRVLVIAYYFPPSGGAGVQRTLKFVRYLLDEGWQPVVLTVPADADFPARDESLLAEVPDSVPVYRASIFEPYSIYRRFTGRAAETAADISSLSDPGRRSCTDRIAEWVRANFFIPDARAFWRPSAVRAGMKIIAGQNIDVMYSSAPPYTCHLVARTLHRRTGIPWIADFRDSWVGWLSTPRRRGLAARIDREMERSVLREADSVVTATAGVRDDLCSRSPRLSIDKFHVINNGYDSADFAGLNESSSDDIFILTYTGSLYGKRSPEILLQALERVLKRDQELTSLLTLRFVGRADPAFLEMFSRFPGCIDYIPYVAHAESIGYLLQSTALLLIIDNAPVNRGILTGKLYEYLGARRPVLALAPEGEAAALIRRLKAGEVADPSSVEDVERILYGMIDRWRSGKLSFAGDEKAIAALDRKLLTRRLAGLLDTVLPAGKTGVDIHG